MLETVEKLLQQDDFSVFVPNVLSLVEKSDEDPEETRRIGGFCSTETKDRQDEIVVAKGLDFDEFVQWGYFNDNHKQDTAAILGYPDVARLHGNRWWTEGRLLRGFGPADRIWELAKALHKSGAPRKLGFSIEGKVLERDGRNKILRAKVRNVAITNCPVNTDCSFQILAKAFASVEDVVRAAEKALAAGCGSPPVTGGPTLRKEDVEGGEIKRDDLLGFPTAVTKVKKRWPHLRRSTCVKVARYAMCKEG